MMKKQGITITMLIITIVMLTIITGTITFSVYSTLNYAKLSAWANEIMYVQDVVSERLNTESKLSYTMDEINIDISKLKEEEKQAQFLEENIVENKVKLYVLDLGELEIVNTIYGSKKTEDDVYAVSLTTGRVYYVKGFNTATDVYHIPTDDLKQRFSLKSTANLNSIVFMPSKIGYTNEAVKVTIKVPQSFSDIVISTDNSNILTGDRNIVNNLAEYIVNSNNITGNYNIIVTYIDELQKEHTVIYNVNGYDNIKPIICEIKDNNFIQQETDNSSISYLTGITATDVSGIKYIKYATEKIKYNEAKTYFLQNGNSVLNGKINLSRDVNVYTIYAEDNAGNYTTTVIDITRFKASLPDEYRKVKYIESTGTQYIDTGIVSNEATFDVKVQATTLTGKSQILIGRSPGSGDWFGTHSTSGKWGFDNRTPAMTNIDVTTQADISITFSTVDGEYGTVNEEEVTGGAKGTQIGNAFTLGADSAKMFGFVGKIWYAKITSNDNLVRYFIPCYRKSDNKPGLYDLVTKTFYTNQGTGEFILGPDVGLPSEYQEVEYIESTGTQYIDTGYNITENFKYYVDVAITDTRTSTNIWPQIIGSYGRSNASDKKNYSICYSPSQKTIRGTQYELNKFYKIIYSVNFLSIDGVQNSYQKTWNGEPYDSVYIFAMHCSNGLLSEFFSICRVRKVIIYDKSVETRHLIPCYRKSDNKPGMYDLVTKTFYTNQGTGEFILGPYVGLQSEYQKVEYIEATGTQYIDTGVLDTAIDDVKIKVSWSGFSSGHEGIVGGGWSSNNTTFQIIRNNETNMLISKWKDKKIEEPAVIGTIYNCEISKTKLKINNNELTISESDVTSFGQSILLFTRRNDNIGDVPKEKSSARIHSAKLMKNGSIVRDLIPCYRKSDNKPGLYDLVTKKFYTNAGTGEFILGPNK